MPPATARTRRAAFAFLCAGALCGGFAAILIRLCRYPAPTVACLRMLLAGLALLPFSLGALRRLWRERGLRGLLPLLAPAALLSAHFQLWVLGLQHTSVASATFIFSINPVFFALAQLLAERRRLEPHAWAALALAVGGALWLFLGSRGGLGRLGDLLVLLATLLYVGYLLASRRFAAGVPHAAFAQSIYFWGGLLGLPAALAAGFLAPGGLGDSRSLLALLGLVLFATLIGHTAANFGVRHLPPLTVSFFSLSEPLVATTAAVLLLKEPLPLRALPAYALLAAATLLYLIPAARR